MGLVVKKPGVLTTVQDFGRFGYMGSGFSPSGVMDRRAFTIANLLVENDPHACALEFALAGPTLRFTTSTFIAITGGDFSPTINGEPVPMYTALMVRRGSILRFGPAKTGVYGYLAIAGGSLNVPEVMGSRSTNLKCEIGGWHGRMLAQGDYLPFVTRNLDFLPNLGSHRVEYDSTYDFGAEECTVRVVLGPQEGLFTEKGLATFLGEPFEITSKCDRMGYRLDGPEVETLHGSDIISDGIAFGAVQVPTHGRPIIMLADRQTTGGYAKIATVASVDIPKLVQCRPGAKVRFTCVSVQEAQELYRKEQAFFRSLAKIVRRPCAGGISPRRTARRLTPILERQARINREETLWINQPGYTEAQQKLHQRPAHWIPQARQNVKAHAARSDAGPDAGAPQTAEAAAPASAPAPAHPASPAAAPAASEQPPAAKR